MHELGIAKDFWQIIQKHAAANNLTRVTKITITLGEASGIEADFLRHSLCDHTLPGTIAEGAELEIITLPLAARCATCSARLDKGSLTALCCPRCGGTDIEMISGKEAHVQGIEGE